MKYEIKGIIEIDTTLTVPEIRDKLRILLDDQEVEILQLSVGY